MLRNTLLVFASMISSAAAADETTALPHLKLMGAAQLCKAFEIDALDVDYARYSLIEEMGWEVSPRTEAIARIMAMKFAERFSGDEAAITDLCTFAQEYVGG